MNWVLLKNSLLVSGLTAVVATSFGFVAALWMAGLKRRKALLAVAVMALALPPFLVTNCWLHFLGATGVWRSWLPLNIVSLGGTVWILSLLTWPIAFLAAASAWQRCEAWQLESDMAVRGWWLIRGLLFPLARHALSLAAMVIFVLALNNFAVPAILQVKVFPAEVWVRFNTTFDTAGALRLSWPLVAGPLVLLLCFVRRQFPWPRLQSPVPAKLFRQQLGGGWFWLCGVCTVTLCVLSVGLPLFQLTSLARTWTELPGALAAGPSAIAHSLLWPAASATIILVLALLVMPGSPARSAKFDRGFRHSSFVIRQSLFPSLLWLAFLLPGVLLGIGLVVIFNRSWLAGFYQSAGIVILAFVIRYLAVGWTAVAHARSTVDQDLTDAATLDGASRWQMLRYVLWPQMAPQAAAAWYVLFLLCLWDVESMILVTPPGGETLALRVFNLLHYGHNAQVNALCLTLLVLGVAPLVLWQAGRVCWLAFRRQPSPLALATMLGAACGATLLAGCSPDSSSSQAVLQSRIFRRVEVIGSRGVGVGELNKPRSVAVDLRDNLYAVDMTGRVQKFATNGAFVLSWQMPQTDKGKPKGMCRDREGNVVVLEPHYQRVNYFSPEGELLAQFGEHGTNAGQFTLPRAVAVNSHDEIFVSEYEGLERVQQFTARGTKLLRSFGHAGTGPGEFNRPEGLFVDAQDRLYVADSCNHRIEIFSSEGKFLRSYGKPGSGLGEFSYPYDICVDHEGRQYVCEFGNSRIQVFDANDRPLEIIGGPGAKPGQFSDPWGLALDSAENLYVADSQNHRVQKLVR